MIPVKRCVSEVLMRRNSFFNTNLLRRSLGPTFSLVEQCRGKCNNDNVSITTLFKPVPVKTNQDDINVGLELSGALVKNDIKDILDKFYGLKETKTLALEYGLDNYLQRQTYESFRRYCLQTQSLPVDLHVILSDILQGAGHITDLFPYFIRHAKQIFPHIDCLDDLKKISDLRTPANWYPNARMKKRKIIFHSGPTNSGKTYHALQSFMKAKSGVYCGPLKLLAVEVFNKCNDSGTPCDLITGEDRKFANNEYEPANHVACTVEMVNVNSSYDVAVIDEIQLMKDYGRGWAWTRALLGVCADEIHVCGEAGTIDLVRSLCDTTSDSLEVRNYDRLTELKVEKTALISLHNVMPGDCIVCFSKNDIYTVSRIIESSGKEVAVIYGSLPPGTKLAQAAKFNDPNHSCKVLVATDAIGMGLNLHIRRIIFYSMVKPTMNEKGEREMDTISVSSALQIGGRAGRHGTQWETGYVTTFSPEDLPTLRNLMSQNPEPIEKAGLHPTADQIEMYAYHLPDSPLSNLMDIFVSLCTVDDSLYFMCDMQDFKFLADMIQHVNLPLRARYVFCCAPINRKLAFVCAMFLKYARQYSRNDVISAQWVQQNINWPLATPVNIQDLVNLEAIFDVLDLYLWLSYRFQDLFCDAPFIRQMQGDLDIMIQDGIIALTKLLKNTEEGIVSKDPEIADFAQGKVSESLLAEGRLTLTMLEQLHKEWAQKQNGFMESQIKEKTKKIKTTKTTQPTKRKPKKS